SGDASGTDAATTITMDSAKTVTANFIQGVQAAGGAVALSYSYTVLISGGTPPYTFSLTTGELPAGLSLNSSTGVISGTPTTGGTYIFGIRVTSGFFTLNSTYSIIISPRYILTIIIAPPGSGSVTASPESPDGYYNEGAVVTLTAAANTDYTFSSWGGDASGTSTTTTVTMDSDKTVAANFTAAGDIITNSIGMQFKLIPAGSFVMGSPDSDMSGANGDEKPQHTVNITRSFYIGIYEVTQAQWREVMGNNPSYFSGDNLPVECVSWDDVQGFITALNNREGVTYYRLPTEAEWEYACRAGSTTRYCFGDDTGLLGDYAWYWSNSGNTTHPVGTKLPNAWGLYDMHGNVWEWCNDWYGETYYTSSPANDPQGPASGQYRVLRGGCWSNFVNSCRSAVRYRYWSSYRYFLIGFRLARSSE
ncbi:MAG: SUMF1/EgtB/PvdO family nonheme iron enzyme, partial [Planctomycetota bacterium]